HARVIPHEYYLRDVVPRPGRAGEVPGIRIGVPLGLRPADHEEAAHVGAAQLAFSSVPRRPSTTDQPRHAGIGIAETGLRRHRTEMAVGVRHATARSPFLAIRESSFSEAP